MGLLWTGSMGMRFNIKVEDVLIFLIEVINKAEEPDEIIKLAKHYIDLFSTEIGDVRYCVRRYRSYERY